MPKTCPLTLSRPTKILLSGLVVWGLTACVATEVPQRPIADTRPTVQFLGAEQPPEQIRVYVNGLEFGMVSDFDEPDEYLRLLAGAQAVELKFEGETIFSTELELVNGAHEVVYLSNPTISVPSAEVTAPASTLPSDKQ